MDPPFFFLGGGEGGGSLSLVLVVLAWLLQLFCFVQVTWVSWTFCWGFFTLDFQCCWEFGVVCTSLWMGLWCGHAVLPFPSFDLVFLFHLLGQVALALVTFFALSLLSLLFIFYFFFISSLSPGSVWSGCVCAFSEASFLCFALTSSPLFLGISCFRHIPVCFAGPVFYSSSSLRFFCRLSRFLSEVVLSSFLEGRSGLGLMSSVLPWVLWTFLLALGKFVLLSLPGPLAVQLRFFLCMWFRQNLGVSSLRRSLWWSAGCSVLGTLYWCCGILSLPYRSLWALRRGFLVCLLSSACGFLFTAFSRRLAAIGVLFVVFLLVVA